MLYMYVVISVSLGQDNGPSNHWSVV